MAINLRPGAFAEVSLRPARYRPRPSFNWNPRPARRRDDGAEAVFRRAVRWLRSKPTGAVEAGLGWRHGYRTRLTASRSRGGCRRRLLRGAGLAKGQRESDFYILCCCSDNTRHRRKNGKAVPHNIQPVSRNEAAAVTCIEARDLFIFGPPPEDKMFGLVKASRVRRCVTAMGDRPPSSHDLIHN